MLGNGWFGHCFAASSIKISVFLKHIAENADEGTLNKRLTAGHLGARGAAFCAVMRSAPSTPGSPAGILVLDLLYHARHAFPRLSNRTRCQN
jgi:hypothetical protein